ncbi:GAF domain-containing protein [Candidatus Parcubacteria bacterium]|nr:GAF domain-containing protein [Candidatus Parcubacteria bacterium]
MNLFILSGLLIGVSGLFFGFFVYFHNRKSKANKLWLFFCISVAIWGFGAWRIGMVQQGQEDLAVFLWRIVHIGIIFIPVFFIHFIYTWLEIKKKLIIFSAYFIGLFFLLINFYDLFINSNAGLFINDVTWLFNSFYWDTHYNFDIYWIFVFLWLFGILYSHYKLIQVYKKSSGVKRIQIKFFLIAFIVSYAGGGTCFLPCFNINLYPFFNLATPFYPFLMAYTIVRHRFLDIKFVLRKSSVFLASLSTILLLAVSAQYISIIFFPNLATWINVLILILAVSFFPIIKNHYYHFANKYFFTSLYDSKKVIADLSDKLRSTLKIENIYKYISETFINSFHTKAVGILIQNKQVNQDKKGDDQYIVQYNKGFNVGKCKVFPGNKKLCHLFMRDNKSIVVEELKRTAYKKHKKTIDLLTKFGVEIVTPLNVKDQTIGLIVLGQKESGDMYNNEDLSVLKIIGAQAAIAIENALLYKETKNFAIKLKKEVQKATADLKTANLQLRKLDAAKSDFISIASHQLRTPLTVIKGYISMMIEGSFGKLTKEELESLKKVYESNERLIRLVEDLLNISRIESGKLQFDFQKTRLEEVVRSVVEELAGSAKRKGLALAYKKPGQPLPMVKIDGEKIRYVVLNLIDNAIKYTKQGSIAVSLRLGMKHIYFCVVDTGIGISKEDLSNLFQKFSRGKNISIVHPEGTGMGLYVGRMMIKAHRGKIWVESESKGKGSKFCFKLPVKN